MSAGARLGRASTLTTPLINSRRRRWLAWSLASIAVITVLRLVTPSILGWWITARLSASLGVDAQIDDVELGLFAGEVTVRGIHAAPAAEASASFLHIDAFTLRWRWRELLRGIAMVDGTVSGLDVTVDLHRPWPPGRQTGASPSSRLRSLDIESGTAVVVLAADTPPIVSLGDLRGGMVTNSTGPRTEAMTTQFWVEAQTGDGGSFSLEGAIAPVEPAANWTLRLALERLDLRALNPLFQQAFEMDVEHGWISIDGWLTARGGRLRGKLQPQFEELQILGRGERRVRHPMAEALFSSMLSGADLPIDIDQATVSQEGSVLDAMATLGPDELLSRVILRGFINRLDTLDGYESAVGRVEVDFPAGRLSFFDVKLTKIGRAVGRPFVTIARLDIVVEQSAVDSEVLTYKSIALHEPSLIFVTGESAAKSQLTFDPQWQAKVNVLPYPTDRVEIFDGRVEYRDDTTVPPTSLIVSDIDVRADHIGRAKAETVGRGATLVGSARVMDFSALTLEIQFSPGQVDLDADMRLRLEPLPLRHLNVVLRGRAGIDFTSGTLAIAADLDVHDGQLRGTVTPSLRDVRVLGEYETEVEHPVREFFLERKLRQLDGTTLTLDHRVRTSVLRELPSALMSAARHAR